METLAEISYGIRFLTAGKCMGEMANLQCHSRPGCQRCWKGTLIHMYAILFSAHTHACVGFSFSFVLMRAWRMPAGTLLNDSQYAVVILGTSTVGLCAVNWDRARDRTMVFGTFGNHPKSAPKVSFRHSNLDCSDIYQSITTRYGTYDACAHVSYA